MDCVLLVEGAVLHRNWKRCNQTRLLSEADRHQHLYRTMFSKLNDSFLCSPFPETKHAAFTKGANEVNKTSVSHLCLHLVPSMSTQPKHMQRQEKESLGDCFKSMTNQEY